MRGLSGTTPLRDGRSTDRQDADGPARIPPSSSPPGLTTVQQAGNRAVAAFVGRPLARRVDNRAPTHATLRRGRASNDPAEVEFLQERLNEDGADPVVEVTGTFDLETEQAVRAFQARHGLAVDGIVGLRTWGMVDELERRGIAGPVETVLDDVAPVTQEQHDAVEQILHPGHSGGAASDPMTGRGVGGAYEREVLAALDTLAAETIARPVATPAVDMAHANRVADLAQEEVERFFGSMITVASRRPTGDWHPGSTRMGLADATTRPLTEGDILGWTDYFMDNGSYPPAQIAASHNYDSTRARPDHAEHDRVRALWLNTRGGRAKVRQMIRAWPAEAGTGTVFLQLRDPGYQSREGMWDLFGTMVHEFLHLVTHPNYSDTADAIGGGARDILVEGMDDHMAQQVWGDVRPRIAGDTPFRQTVEGPFFVPTVDAADYEEDSPIDELVRGHHYDSMADADRIAEEVGESNARAAFFMGHVEALGLGQGTAGEHSLSGLASWRPGAGVGPGVHTTIAQDTLAQIANQHGITQEALEAANGFAHRPGTTRLTPGTVLTIPAAP